ncbi:hypothetical protein ILUMI_04859 [Ignelater luminosus]|uniref:Uncharacterized protein n=1 Tax=Ignelater luminosus TaxID=2038154 RepID=A0A8K0D865_IGNLU|nr:hypothetical protein ILUMI_04859 [Ignelater luminosus]
MLIIASKFDFKVTLENVVCDYYNKSLISIREMKVYKVNRTVNGIRSNFTLFTELDEHTMVTIKGYKFLSNTYRLTAVQLVAPVKQMLEAGDFDLKALFLNYTKPPIVWPLKKGVPYVMDGWFPDGSKYPPNFLEGRWRFTLAITLGDLSKIDEVSYYIKTENVIRWWE